jgi:LysR family hydrogen peroxide-inducible transcriptional activator
MNFSPHPFTLRQLQYAVAVAETLSFRKAAERCHVSQPSLSAQLRALEDGLGVALFERDQRKVLLTQAGKELVERAKGLLLAADDLSDAGKKAHDPFVGNLRMGVIPTVSPYLLPSVAPVLRKRYPKLSISWVEEKTEELVRRLQSGELEAALLALEADLEDLEHETISKDAFVLAAPPGHPLASSKSPASMEELRHETVLLLDEGHCLREQALAVCSRAKAQELEFRATSLPTLAQMVAAGNSGVTLLPALSVPTEAKRAALKIRPFGNPAPHRTIGLAWRRRSPLAPSLKKLSQTLRAAYPSVSLSSR